ncbi:MAG: efflux RND transporter periplasmic adaptor subunit [Planctomycetaceae bacterium]|nr:efflux RND transporter periplasmic adaptor subunit [Planctomycetaceae bacterium]
MKNLTHALKQRWPAVASALLVVTVVFAAGVTYKLWLPQVRSYFDGEKQAAVDPHAGHNHDEGKHDEHDHSHPGHVEESAIEFSVTGLKNIDFEPATVALSTFERSITLPAMVVERPGHSQIYSTAPMTGVVTRIYPVEGAAIEPGSPMFDIRLTHEELVNAQRSFLQTLESFDVVQREIDRLKAAGEGVIAGKRIIEQEYEQQKLQASLRAEQQALLLHGLKQEQIDGIRQTRHLLQSLTVFAPVHGHDEDACNEEHLFHVQQLPVKLGEQVSAGQLLCIVADHCELYIEGRAFEDDAMRLREAARDGRSITATVVVGRRQADVIQGLKLLYLADHVDAETRAFRFYLRLPNKVALDQAAENGRRFIAWRFNPGQRMELKVPVELWRDRIVLPVSAIVEEGAEVFVYERNGDHFDRVAVHVEYKDQTSAVISNDGSIEPGDIVAGKGAYQMHLALKNKAGGGVDPHAGHNH